MKIALLSIGDEVLIGQILDRNLYYIAHALFQSGYKVFTQHTCGDDLSVLVSTLSELYRTHDVVITTGGLGPTTDDRTKEGISKSLHVPLQRDPGVAEQLKKQWGAELASLEEQATVPAGAQILPNNIGTAPGFIFSQEGIQAAFLPGVPAELRAQFQQFVLPWIQKQFPISASWYSKEVAFCLASENAIFVLYEQLEQIHRNVQFGIYPQFSHIKVVLRAQAKNPKIFVEETEEIITAFAEAFPNALYSTESQTIEQKLIHLFQERGLKLALAESCTGGRIAARLVSIPGASDCLEAGLVTYSNAAKMGLLGVSEAILEEHGAVSEETAKAMVKGALQVTKADWALSITGIAGPQGGTVEKPVGTVFMAVGSQKGLIVVQKIPLPNNVDREYYIDSCSSFALYILWQQLDRGTVDLSLL